MRLIHLADLHLGRSLAEFSLIDLQREILTEIVNYAIRAKADAVVIAGDVYDRSTPAVQAVNLLSGFLSALARLNIPVLIIPGNHDSADRLTFLSDILGQAGIHIAGDYRLGQPPVTLTDEYGPVNFFLLPFFRPGHIRAQAQEETVAGYDDAVRVAVSHMPVDPTQRNVLVGHQFVCAAGQMPIRSDSEMLFAGGTELVSAAHFAPFDYVALGHLHRSQKAAGEKIRYCGAPLQYSFGEAGEEKSILVVELREKGDLEVKTVPLSPLRKMTIQTGTFDELMSSDASSGREDFVRADLTDEEYIPDAIRQLRKVWPNILEITYPNISKGLSEWTASEETEEMSPLESLESFYRFMRGTDMSDEQEEMVERFIREIWEVEE